MMKRTFITIITCLAFTQLSNAHNPKRWLKSTVDINNIYNGNTGKVGIGTTMLVSVLNVAGTAGITYLASGSGGTISGHVTIDTQRSNGPFFYQYHLTELKF